MLRSTIMVFKDSQANFEAALATFVIGDLDRKFERSNQGPEVKTTLRPDSIFRSNYSPRLSLLVHLFYFQRKKSLVLHYKVFF